MTLAGVVDTVLDRVVVLGYSKIGYQLRQPHWAADPAPDALRGKAVAVTGAGAGLGTAIAAGLARLGADVHLVVRAPERAEAAAEQVRAAATHGAVHVERCDVSDLAAVAAFASDFAARVPRLHALVHNAGVMPAERGTSAQGHELTLATHVLGPYALSTALAPVLDRVVIMSSGGMYARALHMSDPQSRFGYRGAVAYARTKRAQVVLAELLADDLAAQDVVVHAMHPGWADTPGIQSSLPGFHKLMAPILRDAEQGADTAVWLCAAAEPGRCTGKFWHDRRVRPTHLLPWTRESAADRAALHDLCRAAAAG